MGSGESGVRSQKTVLLTSHPHFSLLSTHVVSHHHAHRPVPRQIGEQHAEKEGRPQHLRRLLDDGQDADRPAAPAAGVDDRGLDHLQDQCAADEDCAGGENAPSCLRREPAQERDVRHHENRQQDRVGNDPGPEEGAAGRDPVLDPLAEFFVKRDRLVAGEEDEDNPENPPVADEATAAVSGGSVD